MALDEAVLTARSRGLVPNTLRFLQFSPPCALVGYHQAVEQEIRIPYCEAHGIEINRRLTGGGGLFWDESQLGWEIYAAQDDPRFPRRAEDLYERLCQGVIRALQRLGVRAAFRPKNDIEVNGRKVSGTGGTSLDGAFLFQGTLLVDFDVDTMLRALRIPTEKLKDKEMDSVRERVTCLAWELGAAPPLDEIKRALAAGVAEAFGVRFEPGPLSAYEREMLADRLPYFQSEEWVYGVRRTLVHRNELRALFKSPGGLIRASLVVDAQSRRIRKAFITGDFFAYPRRAILDLEARLKGVPAEVGAVGRAGERGLYRRAAGRGRAAGASPLDGGPFPPTLPRRLWVALSQGRYGQRGRRREPGDGRRPTRRAGASPRPPGAGGGGDHRPDGRARAHGWGGRRPGCRERAAGGRRRRTDAPDHRCRRRQCRDRRDARRRGGGARRESR